MSEVFLELRSLIPEMERLEAEGRERAFHRERLPENDFTWASDVERVAKDLKVLFRGLAEALDKPELYKYSALADWIAYAAYHAGSEAERCMDERLSRGGCTVDEATVRSLRRVDQQYESITGKRCTWLLGVKEPYTLSAAINDLTACFHRLLEEARKLAGEHRVEGFCLVEKGADPSLVEACKAWSKAEEELRNRDLVSDEDYGAIGATVKDRAVEFRVGSTAGHATHVDLAEGKLEYYDEDWDVNEAMRALFEEQGLKCTHIEGEGVFCEGVTPENVKKVAAKLAAATSMDYRLKDPEGWWGENLENMPEECRNIENRIEREVCAVEKIIDEALEEF